MFVCGLIKLLLIFPFLPFILLLIYSKSRQSAYILIAPLYLLSQLLLCKYIFGVMLGIIIFGILIGGLTFMTIEFNQTKRMTIMNFVRYFFITTARNYPRLYVVLVVIGIVQEYMKLR